jgi:hypothetical protein
LYFFEGYNPSKKMSDLSMLCDVIGRIRYIWRGEPTEARMHVMIIEESTEMENYRVLWYNFGGGSWDHILFEEANPVPPFEIPPRHGLVLAIF